MIVIVAMRYIFLETRLLFVGRSNDLFHVVPHLRCHLDERVELPACKNRLASVEKHDLPRQPARVVAHEVCGEVGQLLLLPESVCRQLVYCLLGELARRVQPSESTCARKTRWL